MSSSTSYPARSEEMVQPNSIAYVSMASEVTQLRLRCSRLEEERDKYRNFLRNWIELARTWDKLESESAEQQVMITGTTPSLSPPALAAEIQRVKSEEKMQENPHDSRCPPKVTMPATPPQTPPLRLGLRSRGGKQTSNSNFGSSSVVGLLENDPASPSVSKTRKRRLEDTDQEIGAASHEDTPSESKRVRFLENMSSESVPLALPSVPQDSRIVGKSRSQMAAMKAEDSVKTLVNRPKCERCARAGKDCLRRSDQLVGARCMKCVVSKKGCVYPSKKSASEKVHKARSNDKRERDEDDDDDDVGTLEKTPKFLRSSKKGKQLDESPGAAASSSQARRLVPFVDLVTSKKDSSSSLITKPFGSGDSSAIHHSTYGLVEHPHPSTTSLPVSSANYPSIVGNHEFRIKMLRVKLEALQEDLQLANQRRSERYPRYENGNIVALRHKLKELEGMQLEEIIKSGQRSKVHMHRPTFTSQLGHEEFYGSYISYTLT